MSTQSPRKSNSKNPNNHNYHHDHDHDHEDDNNPVYHPSFCDSESCKTIWIPCLLNTDDTLNRQKLLKPSSSSHSYFTSKSYQMAIIVILLAITCVFMESYILGVQIVNDSDNEEKDLKWINWKMVLKEKQKNAPRGRGEEDLIPKIIHQSWKTDVVPELPKDIMRADVARYMYMHRYGGLYADLDMECLQPVANLLSQFPTTKIFTGYMNHLEDFNHNIPNAFMISSKGHPLWLWILRQVMMRLEESLLGEVGVEYVSGPVVFKFGIEGYLRWGEAVPNRGGMVGGNGARRVNVGIEWVREDGIVVLEPEYIYPVDWAVSFEKICNAMSNDFDPQACKQTRNITGLPGSNNFAITYWTHSWGDQR
ncbi:hypothetical protein HDU76_001291 [Blyttiomyces sp. JEL0837]|nr:hypothetical protein HDU76_001291 [Blyttiomyces sp. JEL0837]